MPLDDGRSGDFIQAGGLFFLAHRLRRLSDGLVAECERWFVEAEIIAPPRTTSMLYLIERKGPQQVTAIAYALRQFHPVVIDWVKKLKKMDLLATSTDPVDGRRTIVSLTPLGRTEVAKIHRAEEAITAAYCGLEAETGVKLMDGIAMWEAALSRTSLLARIRKQKS